MSMLEWMSYLNDHRLCLAMLDSDDESKRKLMVENINKCVFTFGKHKGKTFFYVFHSEKNYTWWLCSKAKGSPSIDLFKRYCAMNSEQTKVEPLKRAYVEKGFVMPPKKYMRVAASREAFCRLCNGQVEVKETFQGDQCMVCDYPL